MLFSSSFRRLGLIVGPFFITACSDRQSVSEIQRASVSPEIGFSNEIALQRVGDLGFTNFVGVPFDDRMVFNRMGTLDAPPSNGVHDLNSVVIRNLSNASLNITKLTTTGEFVLSQNYPLPHTLLPGAQLRVSVRFRATGGSVHNGVLAVEASTGTKKNIELSGFWQRVSEGGEEPSPSEILQVYGYKTTVHCKNSCSLCTLNSLDSTLRGTTEQPLRLAETGLVSITIGPCTA